MSLTEWFNDYIFTPLVWSRWVNKVVFGKKWEEHKPHFMLNLIIVFLISGLWHGAGETFVLWGLLHGVVRVLEELTSRLIPKKKRKKKKTGVVLFLCRAKVFIIWVFAEILFRAETLSDVGYIFSNMFKELSFSTVIEQTLYLVSDNISNSTLYYALFFAIITVGFVLVWALDVKSYKQYSVDKTFDNNPLALYGKKSRWTFYWIMGLSVMLFYFINLTGANSSSGFIYLGF